MGNLPFQRNPQPKDRSPLRRRHCLSQVTRPEARLVAGGRLDAPEAVGLTSDDLLCGIDGKPRRTSWSMNPHVPESAHYCLDPSSARARAYLQDRIRRIVRDYGADLLKLDFGYGLPNPD